LLLILLRMIYFIFLWVSFTALLRLPMTSSWVYKVKDLGTIQYSPHQSLFWQLCKAAADKRLGKTSGKGWTKERIVSEINNKLANLKID